MTPATTSAPGKIDDAGVRDRVPQWLLLPEQTPVPHAHKGRHPKSFVERTLADAAALVHRAMYADADESVSANTALQRLDPRFKLVSLLVVLVAVALVHNPVTLLAACVAVVLAALAGGVRVGPFLWHVWLVAPVPALVAIGPSTLSIVVPGEVVLQLWSWAGQPQGLTREGLLSAALLFARILCSVSLVLLVTRTTPWDRLLAALGALGVPRVFVMIVAMAYRYLFLLLGLVVDTFTARKARTILPLTHDAWDRRFVASEAGLLFGHATLVADEVHQAMVARGYTGRHYPRRAFRSNASDFGWLLGSVVAGAAMLWIDHVVR